MGEVVKGSDDFFSGHVVVAARITERARGGEILVSSVLKELLDGSGDIAFGEGRLVDLGGRGGVRQVHEVPWAGAPAREPTRAAGNVFRCEGEYWTLALEGSVCRLRDSKGLHHIARLLRHPGQPFEARELALELDAGGIALRSAPAEHAADGLAVADLGDAGVVLDAKAKAEYRRRLDDLREELAEAERFNDPGRTVVAREEIEFLTGQLTAAVGLGGRDRKSASSSERARLTVTKRIKDSLGKIRDANPALGQYLAAHVKTGYFCVYMPAPGQLIPWEF